jgi:hypothetical protein
VAAVGGLIGSYVALLTLRRASAPAGAGEVSPKSTSDSS